MTRSRLQAIAKRFISQLPGTKTVSKERIEQRFRGTSLHFDEDIQPSELVWRLHTRSAPV